MLTEDSLLLSKKREQAAQVEKLNAAQRGSQERDQKCSNLEEDMYDMQKKMVANRDDSEQQEKSKYRLNNF